MGRLDLVAAAGIGIEEVEELLDREVHIIENERRKLEAEKLDEIPPVPTTIAAAEVKEEKEVTSFPLRNATNKMTNQQDQPAITLRPVLEKKPSVKSEKSENVPPQATTLIQQDSLKTVTINEPPKIEKQPTFTKAASKENSKPASSAAVKSSRAASTENKVPVATVVATPAQRVLT